MKHFHRFIFRRTLLFSFLALLALAGCTAQYVSRYDEVTERSITSIQRQVETLLQDIEQSLGTAEAAYENYADAYKQLHIDAAMLHTRAQAIDFNRITIEQSQELIGWLNNLKVLHQSGIKSGALLAIPRQQAEQIFVAMLKFELAKKRQLDSVITNGE